MYNCMVCEDSWNDLWNRMFIKFIERLSELQSTKQCVNKWITLYTHNSPNSEGRKGQLTMHILYQPVLLYPSKKNDLAGFP